MPRGLQFKGQLVLSLLQCNANGHVVCKVCVNFLAETCPVCRYLILVIRLFDQYLPIAYEALCHHSLPSPDNLANH